MELGEQGAHSPLHQIFADLGTKSVPSNGILLLPQIFFDLPPFLEIFDLILIIIEDISFGTAVIHSNLPFVGCTFKLITSLVIFSQSWKTICVTLKHFLTPIFHIIMMLSVINLANLVYKFTKLKKFVKSHVHSTPHQKCTGCLYIQLIGFPPARR